MANNIIKIVFVCLSWALLVFVMLKINTAAMNTLIQSSMQTER